MTAREVLDGIKDRFGAASPGPWEIIGGNEYLTGIDVAIGSWDEGGIRLQDAAFIAAAPVDVARLTRAVENVLVLHQPVEGYIFGAVPGAPPEYPVCSICFTDDERPEPWPCPTVAAIEDALNQKEGQ